MSLTKDEEEFWETLKSTWWVSEIRNNEDLTKAIMYGKTKSKTLDVLGEYFVKVATVMGNKKKYKNYSFRGDMIGHAVMYMMQNYKSFNPSKSNQPLAYLHVIAENAFCNYIAKERKQQEIKKELLEIV